MKILFSGAWSIAIDLTYRLLSKQKVVSYRTSYVTEFFKVYFQSQDISSDSEYCDVLLITLFIPTSLMGLERAANPPLLCVASNTHV